MSRRTSWWVVAALTAGCASEVGPAGPMGTSGWTPTDDVEAVVAQAARRGCARLEADCSHLCESVFASCHPSTDACVREETREHLEHYVWPAADPERAAQCAAQIEVAPCSDLTPDTLECEYAVFETCPEDDDGFGANQSPFHPAPLALGETHVMRLCESVPEFFAVELAAGQRLVVTAHTEDDERVSLDLWRLVATRAGGATLEEVSGHFGADGDETAPMPDDGIYLLEVDAYSRGGRYTLDVEAR